LTIWARAAWLIVAPRASFGHFVYKVRPWFTHGREIYRDASTEPSRNILWPMLADPPATNTVVGIHVTLRLCRKTPLRNNGTYAILEKV